MSSCTDTKTFPKLPAHEAAECFNCTSKDLEKPEASGYLKGAYRRYCPACKMFTFYDVKKAA